MMFLFDQSIRAGSLSNSICICTYVECIFIVDRRLVRFLHSTIELFYHEPKMCMIPINKNIKEHTHELSKHHAQKMKTTIPLGIESKSINAPCIVHILF